ncbi:MAG: 50S ribosomal protein L4 [Candidatus Altiarchaeota archaeon]|nr:50S ribosomal protein L4 [Candidatus Altiarchaeota archaeon]
MVNVYSIKGEAKGKANLPKVFSTPYRPDLIQKSVVSEESALRQRYSNNPKAGFGTSADYFGARSKGGSWRQTINKGMSRLPREKPGGGGLGRVRIVPQSKGGHRSHPPKGRDYTKKINNKEYELALKSAVSAAKDKELVSSRGHTIDKLSELPLVFEDSIEKVSKTKELKDALKAIGLQAELERVEIKKREGRSELRSRGRKVKKSMLIIVNEDKGVIKAAANIPGVDAVKISDLKVSQLAPGAKAGRLTVWSESALKKIGER